MSSKFVYVNADIQNKLELAQRLMDGEELYWKVPDEDRYRLISFDSTRRGSPFCEQSKTGDSFALISLWDRYAEFCVRKEEQWYDNIPEQGVLCWVKTRPEHRGIVRTVIGCSKKCVPPYLTDTGANWTYATPLTKEEVLHYVYGE